MSNLLSRLQSISLPQNESEPVLSGRLTRVVGLTLEAVGIKVPLGQRCRIDTAAGPMTAEVVGFSGSTTYLMPTTEIINVQNGDLVTPITSSENYPYGLHLLGRVVDGLGNPIDGKGPLKATTATKWHAKKLNPMARRPIKEPLDVGIKAINSMLTIGQGQRIGLFAGSGVGKSVLLGMMTRGTTADVVVVGLIGERGREVKEFIEEILGAEGRARSVVVAAPADASPLMRLKGSETALTIAEYFRDQGLNVLLLMDSLTRYAQAQREIALAIGEPPATKGYPPSVFAKLPALVERAGNAEPGGGSITAFYTVLSEGDDQQDPIADAARGVLDGHFVLSRALAEEGHYPAIDISASVSRVMPQVTSPEHLKTAQRFKQLWTRYQQSRDLISVGAYVPGGDPDTDLAIERYPAMSEFLRQGLRESEDLETSVQRLSAIVHGPQQG